MADGGPAVRLTDVGANLKRRWRVIAIAVAVCVFAAIAAGLLLPRAYTATSVLTVNSITASPFDNSSSTQQVSMTTERAVVRSREVAEKARALMDTSEDTRDLVSRISVTSPTDAQVIEIEAEADSPDRAAAVANAFARGYLTSREESATQTIEDQITKLDEHIKSLTRELPEGGADENPATEPIQNEINSLRETRSELLATTVSPGRVITEAAPPRYASSPKLLIFGAGGVAGGLVAGVALALLWERFDPRVRTADRLAEVTGLSVIDHRGSSDDEISSRITVRLGLDFDTPLVTVGVLGVDKASTVTVSRLLSDHLRDVGYDALLVPRGSAPSAPEPWNTGDLGKANGARVVLISAAAQESLAKTAMLGKRVDKVIVTASLRARLSSVTELLEELTAAGAGIDALVAVNTSNKASDTTPTPPPAKPREPAESDLERTIEFIDGIPRIDGNIR